MNTQKILLLLTLAGGILPSYGQSDSLTVVFAVIGPKREKFDVYRDGKHFISAPRGGFYFDSFHIARPHARQNVPIIITRAKLFGLAHQTVSPSLGDTPGYRYLIYARDPYRKNRYPITVNWTNVKPRKPWACGYHWWQFWRGW